MCIRARNVIVVTNKKVEGTISTITEDETFIIENETYELYAPNAAELLADYKIGQEGTFFLNDRNEIVDAEVGTDGHYGSVTVSYTHLAPETLNKIISF